MCTRCMEKQRHKVSVQFRKAYDGPGVQAVQAEYCLLTVEPTVVNGRVRAFGSVASSGLFSDNELLLLADHCFHAAVKKWQLQAEQHASGAGVPIPPASGHLRQRVAQGLNADELQGTPVKIVAVALRTVVNHINDQAGGTAMTVGWLLLTNPTVI